MVTFLPKAERGGFAQEFGRAIGAGTGQGYLNALLGKAQAQAEQKKLLQEYALKGELEERKQSSKFSNQLKMMKELGIDLGVEPAGRESELLGEEEPGEKTYANQPKLIPQEKIMAASLVNPAVADKMQKHNDQIISERRHRETLEFQKEKISPEHQRAQRLATSQAASDVKYNQSLEESSKQHFLKEQTLNRLEALNKKGVSGKPYERLLEKFGLVSLTSSGRREFSAEVKNLITDIRSILGSQFTGFEFQTILNAYPSADFSSEANSAIIKNLRDFQDIKKKEIEFANQIKKEGKGKIPEDFQSKVNERLNEYVDSKIPAIKENTRKILNAEYKIPSGYTLMFDDRGEPLSVPEKEVDKYLNLGATLP